MTLTIPAPSPKPVGVAEVYSFLSQSEPGLTHFTFVFADGRIECTCKGYQFGAGCWHYRAVENNYHSCLCGRRFKTARGLQNHYRVHRRKS